MTATAQSEGLVGCKICARVWPMDHKHCARCGAKLKQRSDRSMIWVVIWWLLGVGAFIPAMTLPMLETRMLLRRSEDTILEGVVKLVEHGSYLVAIVVFLASVVVPLAKLAIIAILVLSSRRGGWLGPTGKHRLLEGVEFIGRWSMIDIFVVAILTALVNFSFIATVKPGPAAFAFALSVIFTMLSALCLDPRQIWDTDISATKS